MSTPQPQPNWLPMLCECEYAGHEDDGPDRHEEETAYKVETIFGTFHICKGCFDARHMTYSSDYYLSVEEL